MSELVIKENTVVSAHYRGTFTNSGDVFDSSEGREALTFLMGFQQMIPGFEAALVGKKIGEKLSFDLSPKEAYGERDPNAILEVPLDRLPPTVKVGDMLAMQSPTGQTFPVRVSETKDDLAVLDMNHELAGKALSFDVEIVAVREANETEISRGMTMEQIEASQSDCCATGTCGS